MEIKALNFVPILPSDYPGKKEEKLEIGAGKRDGKRRV